MENEKMVSLFASEAVVERTRLAKSSVTYYDLGPSGITTLGYGTSSEPDKMTVPSKWPDLVKVIRFFYERDPIASTVINKFVDIGINEINNNQGDADDETLEVYEFFKDALIDFLKKMSREYLLSGLVIPEITWASTVVTLKSGKEKVFTLPQVMWIRDPATITAVKTPIPDRINYYVEVDEETRIFIENKGKYSDGTEDKATYDLLRKNYPAFVKAIQSGKIDKIPLENPYYVVRRAPVTGKAYPTPYLLAVLEPLSYKRKLRKMDYSIAARVISAIQVIKLGSDKFPLTESDESQLDDLRLEMRYGGQENNVERVFQLFGNHTLDISWVFPDTKTMLDKVKYETANSDIMFGLGFPRILLSGETEKSATSSPEFAMFSPSESIKAMRLDLLPFVKKLYKDIAKFNDFKQFPKFEFASLRLYDVAKMSGVITNLIDKAALSKTTALKTAGFDFMTEIENTVRERDIMKENDIPEFAPQPFSPRPGVPGTPNTKNVPNGKKSAPKKETT
jgi:hypothetical protein